jgi:hypothetical protein
LPPWSCSALTGPKVTSITRLRLDAALYHPAPPRLPGTNGRPRTKGARLPNLSEVLRSTHTPWQPVTVPGWYGEGERLVEICTATAVWRHGGMPVVPIRWVLIRDPRQRFSRFCCELAAWPWAGTNQGMARQRRVASVRPDQSFKGRQFTAG